LALHDLIGAVRNSQGNTEPTAGQVVRVVVRV
jgi:hypothetical protein